MGWGRHIVVSFLAAAGWVATAVAQPVNPTTEGIQMK